MALNSRKSKKQETYSRRLAIYQQVLELQQRGFSQTEIAQKLGTNRTQIRRYLKSYLLSFKRIQFIQDSCVTGQELLGLS